jgi:hypothetical protein
MKLSEILLIAGAVLIPLVLAIAGAVAWHEGRYPRDLLFALLALTVAITLGLITTSMLHRKRDSTGR